MGCALWQKRGDTYFRGKLGWHAARGIHIGSRESVDSIVGRLPVMPGTCNATAARHRRRKPELTRFATVLRHQGNPTSPVNARDRHVNELIHRYNSGSCNIYRALYCDSEDHSIRPQFPIREQLEPSRMTRMIILGDSRNIWIKLARKSGSSSHLYQFI